jgi:hypothetical protein
VVLCRSMAQAQAALAAVGEILASLGLELHPDKTQVVVRHEVARSEWIRRWEGRRMSVT